MPKNDTRRPLALGRRETCKECEGAGLGYYSLECFWCSGKGSRLVYVFVGRDSNDQILERIASGEV